MRLYQAADEPENYLVDTFAETYDTNIHDESRLYRVVSQYDKTRRRVHTFAIVAAYGKPDTRHLGCFHVSQYLRGTTRTGWSTGLTELTDQMFFCNAD
jgi:hypothetical protein